MKKTLNNLYSKKMETVKCKMHANTCIFKRKYGIIFFLVHNRHVRGATFYFRNKIEMTEREAFFISGEKKLNSKF